MIEQTTPKPLSRRDFLKLACFLPIAAAVPLMQREAAVINDCTFVSDGVRFQPIYERHQIGPEIKLHSEASAIFVELNQKHTTVKLNSDGSITKNQQTQYNMDPQVLVDRLNSPGKQQILLQARNRKLPVAFGDVATMDKQEDEEVNRILFPEDKRQFYGDLLLTAASFLPEALRKTIEKKTQLPMTRRQFIVKGATALTALLGTIYGGWLSSNSIFFLSLTAGKAELAKQTTPYNRFLLRLHGLASDIHPESAAVFTRNLIMALKIKQLGKYLINQGVKEPTISFIVGASHAGIEDFICLPEEMLRTLIATINKDYLGRILAKYGSHTVSTRIIQANDAGSFEDVAMLRDEELLSMLH